MGWVKDRQNTQKPKTEKKQKRAEHTIQSRTAPMCFPFRCYTRFTGCRLCRRPLQNSVFVCYDDLSDAKQYSCNLLFYWLGLLFAVGPQLDASPEVNIEVAPLFFSLLAFRRWLYALVPDARELLCATYDKCTLIEFCCNMHLAISSQSNES